MDPSPLPFDRSQTLYILGSGVKPYGAPDRAGRRELRREDLLEGNFEGQRLHRVALATDAGLGKTYNLKWLRHELNDPARSQCAFLLKVGDLPPAADLIEEKLVPMFRAAGNMEENEGQLRTVLQTLRSRRQLVLLLDGLDQASDASLEHLVQLLDSESDWCGCRMVLAGRPFALQRHWSRLFGGKQWHFVQIAEFSSDQQRRALGTLADGTQRYDVIPVGARSILMIPRVLEYLRPLGESELAELKTVSDVYWRATRYMLQQALGDKLDRLTWHRLLALLGAMAFTMYAGTEKHATTGELHPNLEGVSGPNMVEFLEAVLARMERAHKRYDEAKFKADLRQLSDLNAVMNHGWFDVDTLISSGGGCVWRNASLQEFFAAYWMTRWGDEKDTSVLHDWVVDPLLRSNRAFYWFWRYASEMPDEAVSPNKPPTSWIATMAALYEAPKDEKGRPIRSTEFIYRSWSRMHRYNAAPLNTFLQEFGDIRAGNRGPVHQRVAEQLIAGFIAPQGLTEPGSSVKFRMGAEDDQPESVYGARESGRDVTLTHFLLHRFCVTNLEYELFDPRHNERRWAPGPHPAVTVSKDPSADDMCPRVFLSWYDAYCYAHWLDVFLADGNCQYRIALPTEAQWEYCCRAGRKTPFAFYEGHSGDTCSADLCNFNGYYPISEGETKGQWRGCTVPVDGKVPWNWTLPEITDVKGENSWGFHQMHGNVWELCSDCWKPGSCDLARRGGAWCDSAHWCEAFCRALIEPDRVAPTIGFRLAAVPIAKDDPAPCGNQ